MLLIFMRRFTLSLSLSRGGKQQLQPISEDIPKPPSDPAPTAKESQLIEDEAPWRRPTSIRLNRSNQLDNPPKIRNYTAENFHRFQRRQFNCFRFLF